MYFGKSSNSDEQQELNQEITDLLDETELCKNRIQILMQEVNKDVSNTTLILINVLIILRVITDEYNPAKLKGDCSKKAKNRHERA